MDVFGWHSNNNITPRADVLIHISIVIKHNDRKPFVGERVYFTSLFSNSPSFKEVREEHNAAAQRKELVYKSLKNTTHWAVLHGLLNLYFFIAAKTNSSGVAPPTVNWTLLHHALIKNALQACPQAILVGKCSQMGFLLPK